MCMTLCVCVRACVHACVRAWCVRVCVCDGRVWVSHVESLTVLKAQSLGSWFCAVKWMLHMREDQRLALQHSHEYRVCMLPLCLESEDGDPRRKLAS